MDTDGSGGAPDSVTAAPGAGPATVAAVVAVVLVLITAAVSWSCWTLNRHNEKRLLEVQTRQAQAVVASTVLALSQPLTTALRVAQATNGDGSRFAATARPLVAGGQLFVTASLFRLGGASPQLMVSVGSAPELPPSSAGARSFIQRAASSPTFVVTSIPTVLGQVGRVGYAVSDPTDARFVVYAERAIPANRQVAVERGSAFAELHFATYLGPSTAAANLATTDLPPSTLPMRGTTARASIPFGNTTITLVTAAKDPLGGDLGRDLPWILLAGGICLAIASAFVSYQLVRRRRIAESDSRTIAGLYGRLDVLYGEQRSIAQSLQQALLPAYNPSIPHVEIASRYLAGAQGVDIGGDWFSVIRLGDHHFGFVVGDVSGRGVSAATVMARLRFTMQAYLLEGHSPEVVLQMMSRQIELTADGHFATVLIGVADLETRCITLANAGHFPPLIVSAAEAGYAQTRVGLPLGIEPGSYDVTTVVMPAGSTLVAFTDGLVERRGESLDVGLARLSVAASHPEADLDALIDRLVADLTGDAAEDDVALLAFRWVTTAAEVVAVPDISTAEPVR